MFFFLPFQAFSEDSICFFQRVEKFNKKRFAFVCGLQTLGYGSSLTLLGTAWYKNYPRSHFHSFDDSPEWLQMDKVGHVITSWYLGKVGSSMYEWSGIPKHKAVMYGALTGWCYLTAIEMFDGVSEGWGFSWTDFSANLLGSTLIIGQNLIRPYKGFASGLKNISFKYSFHQTKYPSYRPALLGKTLLEQALKDYNGQSYWLSLNIASFTSKEIKLPKWMNISFGYGAEGMITGRNEKIEYGNENNSVNFNRYRKYFLSFDIDLTQIKTQSYFLKTVAETFCFIKIPAPTLEFSRYGVKGYPIYF